MEDKINNKKYVNLSEAGELLGVSRQMVSKLKENYMRISYIIYLLNMPNKKEKKKSYTKQYENKINKIIGKALNKHTLKN